MCVDGDNQAQHLLIRFAGWSLFQKVMQRKGALIWSAQKKNIQSWRSLCELYINLRNVFNVFVQQLSGWCGGGITLILKGNRTSALKENFNHVAALFLIHIPVLRS